MNINSKVKLMPVCSECSYNFTCFVTFLLFVFCSFLMFHFIYLFYFVLS